MGEMIIEAGSTTEELPRNSKGSVSSCMGFTATMLEVTSTATNNTTTMMNVPVNRIPTVLSPVPSIPQLGRLSAGKPGPSCLVLCQAHRQPEGS